MISVIIPTYKNREVLIKNLTHNLQFLKNCQIIIVNDDPSKNLEKDLKKFKNVILIENKKNLGFGQSINEGVKKAQYPYIMLLNNDVKLINNNYQLAINYFNNDSSLFAVSFAQKEKNGEIVGKNIFYWGRGLVLHKKPSDIKPGYNAWAEGGSCLVDKNKFLKLDGFDPIYSPFYWEDIDLSYRAWKMGYQIIFEPKIVVEHHHETTIGKYFSKEFIKKITFRNQLIFIWKNITNLDLLIKHVLFLPFNLFYYFFKKEFEFINGFFSAIRFLPKIKRDNYNLTDKEILKLFYE